MQLLPLSFKLTEADEGEERAEVYSRRATVISQTSLQWFQLQCREDLNQHVEMEGGRWSGHPGWTSGGGSQPPPQSPPLMRSMARISATWGIK